MSANACAGWAAKAWRRNNGQFYSACILAPVPEHFPSSIIPLPATCGCLRSYHGLCLSADVQPPEIERLLCHYYQSLSEKDRRRFAALEAIKLGHGGIRYIAKVLACDPQTVQDGMRDLKQLPT